MDFRNLDGRVGAGLRQEYLMATRFQQHVNEFQEISIVIDVKDFQLSLGNHGELLV